MATPLTRPVGALLLAAWLVACSRAPERAVPLPVRQASVATPPAGADEPLLLMADLMALVIDPAAGVLDPATHRDAQRRPRTPEAWQAVDEAAQALDRAAEVLQEPGWSLGRGDWLRAVADLREGARASASAARSRDARRLADAGEQLRSACGSCHARHAPDQR